MRVYGVHLEGVGLTYPQYLVMGYLWGHGERYVDEIGEGLLLDSGTLTPLLKRLQSKGLISRRRCSQDERRCIIALTKEGVALEVQGNAVQQAVRKHFNLDSELVERLNEALDQVLDNVQSK